MAYMQWALVNLIMSHNANWSALNNLKDDNVLIALTIDGIYITR